VTVHVVRRGEHVLTLTLDRTERRNALDHATLEELLGILGGIAPGTRALDVSGAGGHFCSGADLSGVEDTAFVGLLQQVLDALRDAPFPTIAAVTGAALGAGTQLAIACDLRTTSPGAQFGIPAAKLGLMVNHWTTQRLASLAGQGAARAMLLAAEVLSGDDALRCGLAQRVCDVDGALAWADRIAELAPLTISGHKVMLNRLEPVLDHDPEVAAVWARAWDSADLQEGLAAFRERRPPQFSGQ